MNIPIYNCIVEDGVNDITGIYAISFVDSPANEVDFIALKQEAKTPVYLNRDSQKQILTGVVLKPEQLIYRFSEQLGEYYIKFSAEQIERIAQKMMKTGLALQHTTHQHEKPLKGNYLTELWIVENPELDKSKALGFQDLPKGTLMCSYKIEDSEYWKNEVMTGHVKGFSLEGFFNQELNLTKINNSKNMNMNKTKKKIFRLTTLQRALLKATGMTKQMLDGIEAIVIDDNTDSGEAFIEYVLKDGKVVKVDETGYATLEGEQMAAGEHPLADGNILVIDENGNFVETIEASATNTDPEEATPKETLKRKQQLQKEKIKQLKHKLEEENANNADSSTVAELEAKIADMQATIDALTKALEDVSETAEEVKEVAEELKKKTPSAPPAIQKLNEKRNEDLSPTERMALAIQSKIKRKK